MTPARAGTTEPRVGRIPAEEDDPRSRGDDPDRERIEEALEG